VGLRSGEAGIRSGCQAKQLGVRRGQITARRRQKPALDWDVGKRIEEWVKREQGRMPSRSEAGKALVRYRTTRRA
jgi:hypothetical protein